jgi:uncharacterized membrane protein YkoI
MRRRFVIAATVTAALALALTAFAFGGGRGLIWDDGHYAKPGSLDDGKSLLPQTRISLGQAVAKAQRTEPGALGQVDLEHYAGKLVYSVDVGGREVKVDAVDGSIAGSVPRD